MSPYHGGSTYDALTPDLAQLVVWADCRPESAELARNAIVAAADELATAGPTDVELDRAVQEAVRRVESPEGVYEGVYTRVFSIWTAIPGRRSNGLSRVGGR